MVRPTHGGFVSQHLAASMDAVGSEFLLLPDALALQRAANRSDIGARIHGCGLGAELVLLLPPIIWLRGRRRRARR
jgi:hypothetical protein